MSWHQCFTMIISPHTLELVVKLLEYKYQMTSEINTSCSHVQCSVCPFGKSKSSLILADQCEHIIIVPVYNSSASTSRLLSQSPWTFEQCDGPNDFLLHTSSFFWRVKRELLSTVFNCDYALWLRSLLAACLKNHLPLPVSTVGFALDCVCVQSLPKGSSLLSHVSQTSTGLRSHSKDDKRLSEIYTTYSTNSVLL